MQHDDNHSEKLFLPVGILFSFLAALRFLTLFPVSWRAEKDIHYLPYAIYFFPVVGIAIGAVVGGIGLALVSFFSSTVVGSSLVVLLVFASGGLHLDGLADSSDGLLSSRPSERMLEIMRDSNVGAMGVIGIASVFLIKFSALCSIDQSQLFSSLVLMALSGRTGILLMMSILQYVRDKNGIGTTFIDTNINNVRIAAATGMFWYGVCTMFVPLSSVLLASGVTLATVFSFSWFCHRKINGFTGDTLGAVCELSEMMVAVSLSFSFQV